MQIRIGRLLASFSAIDALYATYRYIGGETLEYLAINVVFVALCSGLFLLSCYLHIGGKLIQVFLTAIIGILAVCLGDNKIFGVLVLFIAFAICVGYGFYVKDRELRLTISASILYSIFYLSEKEVSIIAALRSAIWLAFMIFFALTLWTIFKDQIKKSREDDIKIGKEIIESIMKTNEDLIALARELYKKIQRGANG